MARNVRFAKKRSKFLAGQFFVDFSNLRRKAVVRACAALTDEPSDLRIGFQQVSDDRPLSVLLLRERQYALKWTGTAWIDPTSFEVVRIQAGLGNTMADMGLLRLDADVSYSDVTFNQSIRYWLPARAVVEAETKRQHWRNTHLFSDYRRFDVETQVKTAMPQ